MRFRFEHRARQRASIAALTGAVLVLVFGPLLAVPAVALVALVYYAHQVVAVLVGDDRVRYPGLAVVIVINAAVVLLVQAIVAMEGLAGST